MYDFYEANAFLLFNAFFSTIRVDTNSYEVLAHVWIMVIAWGEFNDFLLFAHFLDMYLYCLPGLSMVLE